MNLREITNTAQGTDSALTPVFMASTAKSPHHNEAGLGFVVFLFGEKGETMEEKTHRNSSPLTIMTVLAVILLIVAIILSAICVRQKNTLRYKSIVTLSMAYAYMQEVYAGEDASEHPQAHMILQSLEGLADDLDEPAQKVKELVHLSVQVLSEENFPKVEQIVLPIRVVFDTENKTVSTDMDQLNRAIDQLETLVTQ